MKKYEEYIEKAQRNIKLFINCKQWSGLTMTKINNWVNNFPEDIKIRYFVYRLLEHVIYYSESDMKKMLKEGVFNKVLAKDILHNQYIKKFSLPKHELEYQFRMELDNTLFVPLLNQEAPFESGNQITRILTQQLRVPTDKVLFASRISNLHTRYKRLIIVDDCIGSGDQCRNFWENQIVSDGKLLREWCNEQDIKAHYVVLVGYESNIRELQNEIEDLNICCVELLQDEHKVFGENSIYWDDEQEMKEAFDIFKVIMDESSVPLLGYIDLDFALIMHMNIPDWTLPMFWRKMDYWELLMERKNSYD